MEELRAFKRLAAKGGNPSASAKMITDWKLDRDQIRMILSRLGGDRKLQTTSTNPVGATRFKAVKEGELRHTLCLKCQFIDSWEHCVTCYGVELKGISAMARDG